MKTQKQIYCLTYVKLEKNKFFQIYFDYFYLRQRKTTPTKSVMLPANAYSHNQGFRYPVKENVLKGYPLEAKSASKN